MEKENTVAQECIRQGDRKIRGVLTKEWLRTNIYREGIHFHYFPFTKAGKGNFRPFLYPGAISSIFVGFLFGCTDLWKVFKVNFRTTLILSSDCNFGPTWQAWANAGPHSTEIKSESLGCGPTCHCLKLPARLHESPGAGTTAGLSLEPRPLAREAAAGGSTSPAREGGAPFDTLWAETRRVSSRPLGGERRAFSSRFPARGRATPDVRMLSWLRRSPAPVFSHVRRERRASCCEAMGASLARAFRNFNLENRAEREISRMKPSPAPRHPSTKSLLQEQLSCEWCGARRAGEPRGGLGGSAPVDLGPVTGWPLSTCSAAATRVSRAPEGGAAKPVTLRVCPRARGGGAAPPPS